MVQEISRFMTPTDVSRYLGISWDMARDIQARDLKRKYGKPKLRNLKTIAIDEIYLGSRHKFITLVMDLKSGAVVFVGDGKGQDALKPFWKRLKSSKAKIQAVASDMSSAFTAAIRKNIPHAAHVFDRFHIVKLFNEKLTELRRELYREATDKMHKDVLKGTRWLLLKNSENLDDEHNERQRLDDALKLNQSLATAYYLKEDLQQLWECSSKVQAERFLERWCARAESTGIKILMKFAKTLRSYRNGILAWYDYPISTGPLEGTNNKIKLMQRRAYGYRDLNFLKLKIYGAHETRHTLIG
jgi:transposase